MSGFFDDVKNFAKTGIEGMGNVTRAMGPELKKRLADPEFQRRVADAKDRGVDTVADEFKAAVESPNKENETKKDNDER